MWQGDCFEQVGVERNHGNPCLVARQYSDTRRSSTYKFDNGIVARQRWDLSFFVSSVSVHVFPCVFLWGERKWEIGGWQGNSWVYRHFICTFFHFRKSELCENGGRGRGALCSIMQAAYPTEFDLRHQSRHWLVDGMVQDDKLDLKYYRLGTFQPVARRTKNRNEQ